MNERQLDRAGFVNQWSETGAAVPRNKFDHEDLYFERVSNSPVPVMTPLPVEDFANQHYRRQVALLVDALDFFPQRPDFSWEILWKAFEDQLKRLYGQPNITTCLQRLTSAAPSSLINEAWNNAPIRVFEYLQKRISTRPNGLDDEWIDTKARKRLSNYLASEWDEFISWFDEKFPRGDAKLDRDSARFLRRYLQGETLVVNGETVSASPKFRSACLFLGYLYTIRNERAHGDSMPPFLSSRASIQTYALPMFNTALIYSLLQTVWIDSGWHKAADYAMVSDNLRQNLDVMKMIFEKKWG